MLVLQKFLSRDYEAIEARLRSQVADYREFERFDRLNTWPIPGHPDIQLMAGAKVACHTDQIKAWQPMLVLQNERGGWSFRGSSQRVGLLSPQGPGNLLILDIDKPHLVSGRSQLKPWLVACWNPGRTVPLQRDYDLKGVEEAACKAFLDLVEQKNDRP